MRSAGVAGFILVITALSFFVFPGHTYLNQDTQIYVAILEHQFDARVLSKDPVAERSHVNFTFYDELAVGVRRITGAPFADILETFQFLCRGIGLWGIFLLATSLGSDTAGALIAAAVAALGATITGPAVLAIEVEPTPRAFAVPLLIAALGLLLAHRRFGLCALFAAGAVLMHAPAAWPVAIAFAAVALRERRALWPLASTVMAAGFLYGVGHVQGGSDGQNLLGHLPPAQEALQRLRAPYNWISAWDLSWTSQYLALSVFAVAGLYRIRRWNVALLSLLVCALLSIPLSLLLLEGWKLAIVPQVQPARALLFISVIAMLVGVVAARRAGSEGRLLECAGWLAGALWIPCGITIWQVAGPRVPLVVMALALAIAISLRFAPRVAVLASALLPVLLWWGAGLPKTPLFDPAGLRELADWARSATPVDAVFAFPGVGHGRQPGWFRAEARRAVVVDWKSGGQVNYLRSFGEEWWDRWGKIMVHAPTEATLQALGVNYVVVRAGSAVDAIYSNERWAVITVPGRPSR